MEYMEKNRDELFEAMTSVMESREAIKAHLDAVLPLVQHCVTLLREGTDPEKVANMLDGCWNPGTSFGA